MILRQPPLATLMAVRTAVVKGRLHVPPLRSGEVVNRGIVLASAALGTNGAGMGRMGFFPCCSGRNSLFAMRGVVRSLVHGSFFAMGGVVRGVIRGNLFAVRCTPHGDGRDAFFSVCGAVRSLVRSSLFGIFTGHNGRPFHHRGIRGAVAAG